jgi:hypothetical protein
VASKKKAKPTQGNVARRAAKPDTGNSAKSSARGRGPGNPAKTEPYRFQPGQSGNPSGRPKSPFTDAARRLAEQIVKADAEKRTFADLAVRGMYNEAIKGNVQAFSALADRLEGKPMQAHEFSGPGGGPIDIHSMSREQREKRVAELIAKRGGFKE